MNIRTFNSGSVSEHHILSKGFEIFETIEGNDMGQMSYEIPQYTNGYITINGGYWNYVIKDKDGVVLFDGWWNSNDEFDETLEIINNGKRI